MTTLFMGGGISTGFLNFASDNTINGIETMGLLFGKHNQAKKKVTCQKIVLCDQFGDTVRCT